MPETLFKDIKDYSEVARNIALVTVPFVLWIVSQKADKRKATHDMISELESAPEIVDRLERLFRHRRFQEVAALGATPKFGDPYLRLPELFLFDSTIVLNYYESASYEILEGAVNSNLIYECSRNIIFGAHDVVLQRYLGEVGFDKQKNYKSLVRLTNLWKQRAEPYNEIGTVKIPTGTSR